MMSEKEEKETWENHESLDKAREERLREIENLEMRLQLENEARQRRPNVNNKEIHEKFIFYIVIATLALIIGYKVYSMLI